MGNSNILRDKFGCEDISRQEYMDRRSKRWNFQEEYLYQTEVEHVGQERLKVISYQINSADKQPENYFQRLKMMSKYLNKGNIQLPLLCISENRDECTCQPQSNEIVKFYYDPYDVVLAQESSARLKLGENFTERQVWYILYNVINALRQFQPFVQPSGNLTAQAIIMNNRGEIKLKTSLTSPFQQPRSSLFINCFAPQQLEVMQSVFGTQGVITRNLYKQFRLNPNVCQVYSLAVTMLSIVTGCHHLTLYVAPFEVNQSGIGSCLKRLQSLGYSKLLVNLLKIMLTQYNNRPLPSQIYQVFKDFEYEILNLQPFSFSLASSSVKSVF